MQFGAYWKEALADSCSRSRAEAFACLFPVKHPGCWGELGTLRLQSCNFSCWMWRPPGKMKISFLSEQEEKKKASAIHFGCLHGPGCPSGWCAIWCQLWIWPPRWCCHLQWGHLSAAAWAESAEWARFLEQLSETAARGWGWHQDAGSRSSYTSPEGFPLLHTRTRDITKSIL